MEISRIKVSDDLRHDSLFCVLLFNVLNLHHERTCDMTKEQIHTLQVEQRHAITSALQSLTFAVSYM